MEYRIDFKPKALKDLDSLQRDDARRVVERINRMRNDLEGDVKHLTTTRRNAACASATSGCF